MEKRPAAPTTATTEGEEVGEETMHRDGQRAAVHEPALERMIRTGVILEDKHEIPRLLEAKGPVCTRTPCMNGKPLSEMHSV